MHTLIHIQPHSRTYTCILCDTFILTFPRLILLIDKIYAFDSYSLNSKSIKKRNKETNQRSKKCQSRNISALSVNSMAQNVPAVDTLHLSYDARLTCCHPKHREGHHFTPRTVPPTSQCAITRHHPFHGLLWHRTNLGKLSYDHCSISHLFLMSHHGSKRSVAAWLWCLVSNWRSVISQ